MNKPNFNRKFLVIPTPEEDEFILSFLNRIKMANAYPSLNSVIKTIFEKKMSIINIVKGNFDKSVFYEFTDLVEDEINKLCVYIIKSSPLISIKSSPLISIKCGPLSS